MIPDLTDLLLEGELVARGYCYPMAHGAPYLPIARSEWLILRLDIGDRSAEGEGIKYVGLTIGRPNTKLFFQHCRN